MRGLWPVLLAAVLLVGAPCHQSRADGGKLIVGVMDRVTWHDLLAEDVEAPALRSLMRDGAVGMMCVRTSGRGGGYATIGAGTRVSAPPQARAEAYPEGWAFQAEENVAGEQAGRVYTSYTTWPVGDNAIVHLGIGELIRQNTSSLYPLSVGLLGGALRRSGLHVACVGNADTPRSSQRHLVAIGMDEQGLVEMGNVGAGLLRENARVPYRLTTDGDRFIAAFRRVVAAADVIVVDLGETSRIADHAHLMPPQAAAQARRGAIERADRLLASILSHSSSRDWGVLILAPNARSPEPGEQFAELTPVVFRAPDVPPGMLSSPSTRRPGVVVNTDIAPTILSYFGVETPPGMVGRPIEVERGPEEALARLERDLGREDATEVVRRYAFRWLPVLAAIGLWTAAGLFLLGDRAPMWARTLVRGLLLIVLSAPGAMLLVGLRPLSVTQMVGAALAVSAGAALLGSLLTGWRSGHALPAILVVGLLVYDAVKNAGMLQWSPLSYSAAGGARFYGIGNEYGGVLLGAAIVALASLLSRRDRGSWGERVAASILLVAIAVLVGSPRFGANFGMALGCAVGFGVLAVYVWRERPGWGDAIAILVLAGVVASAAIAVDMLARGADASHVGRLVSNVRSYGWAAFGDVVARKWSMNVFLMRVSIWSDMAVAALGLLGVVLLARPKMGEAALERPWMREAVIACVVGAIASWLLNDSGVVAAAMVLLYGAGSLAYVGLGRASPQV